MLTKAYSWTKTMVGRAIALIGGVVILMTFIDYLLKWQIYSFLLSLLLKVIEKVTPYIFEIFTFIYLAILSFILWKLYKKTEDSKTNLLEKQIVDAKSSLEAQIKKQATTSETELKSVKAKINEKIFDLKRTLIDFEIEMFRNKGQVGEVSKMIEKLGMDIKRGWGAENTLPEIKEYIKKSGMPNYFLDDLHKVIKDLPESLKRLGDETLKLAEEGLYDPHK